MENSKRFGAWEGRRVLFVGDSLTARRQYPEVVREILGIETFYHCKGGVGFRAMVDGDRGLGGYYDNETDASGILRPLTAEDVADKDLIVFFGGYNNRRSLPGRVGDLYRPDGSGESTVAGLMQYCINRLYELLASAQNLTCRLLIVTVDCSGRYPWVDADGYTEIDPSQTGRTLEAMANMQMEIARYNCIPCCDLFHTSGINRHTWSVFGSSPVADNPRYSPYLLDENGKPVSLEKIRYEKGKSYYQIRDGRVVLETYEANPPFPYIGDQLHKSPAGYRRIGEVIAGAIINAYGN